MIGGVVAQTRADVSRQAHRPISPLSPDLRSIPTLSSSVYILQLLIRTTPTLVSISLDAGAVETPSPSRFGVP
ncbi:hypothetical protein FRC12_009362 [Ceratobasidium sp. 428]|nr:hypothetical protein FRC12_009362 [Ceratobasidium sp. 428]